MSDHKARVQAQFGATAQSYVQSTTHASGDDLTRMVALSGVTATSRVLDVATGGGHTALAFAPHAGHVVASDLTEAMLQAAQAFILGKGHQNVSFVPADAEALPFADGEFDILTCRIAPHHFADIRQAVREFARVLRPGGRFVLVDSLVPADPELDAFINGAEVLRDPTHVRSYTEAEWRTFVAEAGMTVRQTEVHLKKHNFPDWVARAQMPVEAAAELTERYLNASPAVRAQFQIQIEEGQVRSYVDQKLLLIATK
ncbi:MAG TPA: methyltransferase domain-containing protein [Symbiobacteriaceae bacterium]|nr:methyltransferase domain-containing protein [Symbiobacteriaceae bacterium]